MNIDERVKIAVLVKYYGKLLTQKQREIITMYVDNNLSLAEVSEELGITRQAVKSALDTSFESLKSLENELKFIDRDQKIRDFIDAKSTKEIDMTTHLQLLSMLEDL